MKRKLALLLAVLFVLCLLPQSANADSNVARIEVTLRNEGPVVIGIFSAFTVRAYDSSGQDVTSCLYDGNHQEKWDISKKGAKDWLTGSGEEAGLCATKPGTYTISVSFSGIKAVGVLKVKVIAQVQSIEITGTTSVATSKKINLKVGITPSNASDKSVVWASSDTSVATVNAKGQVTGVSRGVAIITATTKDGSNLAASYTIEVTPTIKKIAFTCKSLTNMKPGDMQQLAATAMDATGQVLDNAKIQWSSSNTKAVTVDENGNVTALKNGKATITASYGGKKATVKITVATPKPLTVTCSGISSGVLADKYGMRGTQFINGFVPSYSIPVSVKSLPVGTKSLAIVMTDPDGGNWVHWLAANVSVKGLKDNASINAPSGMVQGSNDFGTIGYGGPTPPSGVHNYVITVYALSDNISLGSGFTLSQITDAMNGLILGQCTITGSYAA